LFGIPGYAAPLFSAYPIRISLPDRKERQSSQVVGSEATTSIDRADVPRGMRKRRERPRWLVPN
jgi:hypothetical protein